jgi:hypothetical protein
VKNIGTDHEAELEEIITKDLPCPLTVVMVNLSLARMNNHESVGTFMVLKEVCIGLNALIKAEINNPL